jgi:tetratricopeptide (TPR) repeat protein
MEVDPANQGVRLNLALAYYKSGQIETAAREFRTVVTAEPGNRQALLLLADCHLRTGSNKEVIELLGPREPQFQNERAFDYLLGMALILEGHVDRGQVLIDRILRNGDSAEAQLLLGTALTLGNDYPGAKQHFARAVELNPSLPSVHAHYGQALLQTGDPEGAAAAFRREVEINPIDFDANLNLGALLRQDHKFEEALPFLKRALQVRPGFPAARYQLGAIYLDIGQLEPARQTLETLVKDAPKFLEAHVSLARVYYRLRRKADGDREQAIIRELTADSQERQPATAKP